MPNKALGQHWLKDRLVLEAIADSAELSSHDAVLEIGPGLGTLTSVLLQRAGTVIAVEYDEELARKLPGQFPGKNLSVYHKDILTFDLNQLPPGYVVVANVPYYITAKILQHLAGATNTPERIVLLVQQEVAEKLCAGPGGMTAQGVFLRLQYDMQLGIRVPKMYFTPPPKVDSQVIVFKKHHVDKIAEKQIPVVRRLVQAGFANPRKKLRSSLAAGLGLSKESVETLCTGAGVSAAVRAQDLSEMDWICLSERYAQVYASR